MTRLTRDGTAETSGETEFSGANGDRELLIFPVQLTTSRIGSLTQLIHVMCVCVLFPFILDIKFVGRTSRGHTGGRSHRIFHPPSFCDAYLNFSREKDSAFPFPRRPRSRILCTNDLNVLHSLGIFICFNFIF